MRTPNQRDQQPEDSGRRRPADVVGSKRWFPDLALCLPPPVTPSDEEPIAAGGRQALSFHRRP